MARAADTAYDDLRRRIVAGELSPGERLREESLAEQLGVSRTPVREALRRLDSEGFIRFEPNRGAHVAAWTHDDLEEIFALRALLEGYCAALAARRCTAADVAALREIANAIVKEVRRSPVDAERMSQLNGQFHAKVLAIASSSRLTAMLASLVQVPLVQRTFAHYSKEALERSARHHLELVAALEVADADWAQAVMHAHVHAALATLRPAVAQPAG